MSIQLVSIIGHFAFFLTALSFVVKDIITLRVLAIFSSLAAILYNYFHPMGSPDLIPLYWCILFALINFGRLFQIYFEKSKVTLSEIELEMLDTSFSNFNKVELAKLIRSGQWETVKAGSTLTTEDETPNKLYFIQNGRVAINQNKKEIAEISDGTFIGEMSFINKGNASATTITQTATRLISWDRTALEQLLSRNPTLGILLRHSISIDLTEKIKRKE